MITHQEAEILISARQDAPLDPVVERELQAHLATCDSCRAFAIATERLTAGIKALPSVPVNPRMRREVMEKVAASRNPITRLLGGFTGGFPIGSVLAAGAMVAIVVLVGWLAFDRLIVNNNDGDLNQLAARPTAESIVGLVATEAATATAPTATTAPSETPAPTDTPEPTVTPEPAATDIPTPPEATEPAPRVAKTVEIAPTSVDKPIDLTTNAEPTAAETAIPTNEPVPGPTTTPEPTVVPTLEPTLMPEPTNTPAIEPMYDTAQSAGASVTSPAIENANAENTGSSPTDIESVDSTPAAPSETPETIDTSRDLPNASTQFSDIAGDPSGHLGLTPDGRLEFMPVPDGASLVTSAGLRMETADSQPGVILLCGDDYCEPSMERSESETWEGDVPLGVLGETSYFLRMYTDRTEVLAAQAEGTQMLEADVISEFDASSPPSAVFESNDTLFTWLPTGQWLEISGADVQVLSGGYAKPTNVRFAPIAANGPILGYFSGNSLIIAPQSAPDAPVLTLESDGVDFDIAPIGDRVAVIRGNDIVIFDMQGNEIEVFFGGEMQPGSLIWLRGGIVFVDRATGILWQIPETAP